MEFWKDVVEKGQKNFLKIEDPILNAAFGGVFSANVNKHLARWIETYFSSETLLDKMDYMSRSVLFENHVLNTSKGYYKNDYMSIFLEDATNWCNNELNKFLHADKEIYQQLIDQNVNVGTYDEFKNDVTHFSLAYSCDVLKTFHSLFAFYKEKIKQAQDSSVVYQLQDSKYCREQAQSDYDCLSYLYNLTSNRKTIFFDEKYAGQIEALNNEFSWLSFLSSFSWHKIKELNKKRESLNRDLEMLEEAYGLDIFIFASLNVAEQFVLRLNQVEANEPPVFIQLNEVGLQELDGLKIPENNKVLARNIIRNIQQAYDYKLLNVNERERLWSSRDYAFVQLENDLEIYFGKIKESNKK